MSNVARNKEYISWFVEATNSRNWPMLDTLVHPQVVRQSTTFGQPIICSAEQLREFHQKEWEIFTDLQETIRMLVAEQDKVAAVITFQGTQTGTMGKHPASGRKGRADFICSFRIEDEKMREIWVDYDTLTSLV